MPSTGELSKKFGVYKTECCDTEIVIGVGVLFPECPHHPNALAEWREIEECNEEAS